MRNRSDTRLGPAMMAQSGTLAMRGLPLVLLLALSACGGGGHAPVTAGGGFPAFRAPGPPSDPWGPYISEASARFDVPSNWIRAVMRQESGGHEYLHGQPITSDAGAAGLMQIMPPTYAELASRYGLGSDPYEPHDNIMAGTAYIKELYDQYGSPAFLAAYNAGPHRVDAYLAGQGGLPSETVNYLASVAPGIARDRPLTGPLAAYADTGQLPPAEVPVPRAFARAPVARCWQDPDAAYDPDAPCRTAPVLASAPARPAPVQLASAPDGTGWGRGGPVSLPVAQVPRAMPVSNGRCWQDPDAAYDPTAPCRPAPVRMAAAPVRIAPPIPELPAWITHAPEPARRAPPVQLAEAPPRRSPLNYLIPSASASTIRPVNRPSVRTVMATGAWAIQVGAFADTNQARRTAESARSLAPRELAPARVVLGTTSPFGGRVLYRARLQGLSAESASAACGELSARAQACVIVPPGG